MPQDQTSQTVGRPAADAVLDELRMLMRDVRAWLDAVPGAPDAAIEDTSKSADLDVAVAALDANAGSLSAIARRAAAAVQDRADQTDAILDEIRRVRTQTQAA